MSQQQQDRTGKSRVSDDSGPVRQLRREEADPGGAVQIHIVAKAAGDIKAVDLGGGERDSVQQRADAGADGCFGQLDLPDVFLGHINFRIRDAPGGLTLPDGDIRVAFTQ